MKIGIDISQIVYEGTGVATYTRLLVENLLKKAERDEFVLLGSSLRNRRPIKEFVKGLKGDNHQLKFTFLPPTLLEFLWNGVHLWSVEKITGPLDVFHSSDWLEPPVSQARKVTTVHDLAVIKYPEAFTPRGGHDIVANQKRKLHFVKQETDLIIAVSENTKNDLVETLNIPAQKIRVVPEAADPIYQPADPETVTHIKDKFLLAGDYFLSVGTREPRKNIGRVLDAFASLDRALPELSLVIVGKYGWGEDSLITYRENKRIKVLGRVEKADLVGLYSGARGFLYPSLYEGFGLPILEAMACGCPVITSNLGSMKEVAGEAAILVDPLDSKSIANAMLSLGGAEKERDRYVVRGLKRAGEFSWEKAALETLEVYREVGDSS